MSQRSRISIVVPTYNSALYLREALASLRWQTFTAWECLCINDGSTDESGEILDQFAAIDPRFRVIHQRNEGIVGALNRGLREARHDWVAIMHADDVAVPKRLEVQHRFTQTHPECIVIGSDVVCTDPDGKAIERQRAPGHHDEIVRLLLSGKNTINHPTVLMRREAALQAGLYREQYEWVEDADLWLRMARIGQLGNVPQVLLRYRQHEKSLTWNCREVVSQRRHAMLAEAYRERGLELPAHLRTPKKVKALWPSASKWARRAAQAGYYRTARKHAKQLKKDQGLTLHAVQVNAIVKWRRLMTIGRACRPPEFPVPDWRQWDCAAEAASDCLRQAA